MPSLLPTRPDGNRRSHRSVYLGKPTRSTNRSALESQERRLNRPKHTPNCRTRVGAVDEIVQLVDQFEDVHGRSRPARTGQELMRAPPRTARLVPERDLE